MSFTMDALQSRSRRETQHDQEKTEKRHETIITTIGQSVKGIADTVSSVIKHIWPNTNDHDDKPMPSSNNNPVVKDVMIDVDAMIVYDQPIENDFVEVAFASQVQTTPRKQQPISAEDIGVVKPSSSLPMSMSVAPKQLDMTALKKRYY